MKLRYVFQFPDVGQFEGEANTGATETTSVQTVSDRDAASIVVDVTTQATGAKYARFYVTDAAGTAVDPTSLLEVKYNGTEGMLCATKESGYYIYNGGTVFDASQISVVLKAPKAYKTYNVVALFSTEEANMVYVSSVSKMVAEPDYDKKHTYSFDYTVTTQTFDKNIEWDATAMAADAATTDPDTDWKTSWAELAVDQKVKWYVVNGSDAKQALELGTARQADKWTIGLEAPFAVSGNEALLTGQTAFTAANWASWGQPKVYAPAGKTYVDLAGYKVICEVYANSADDATPNAKYTLTLHKGFEGSLKSDATKSLERVTLAAGDKTKEISVTLPAGTTYVRAYLTDNDGTVEAPTGLTLTNGTAVDSSVEGYSVNLGQYLYDSGNALTSPATVKFTLSDATLNQHRVVVQTSTDAGVITSSVLTSEPDFDTQTTYWFKYPAGAWATEANVEWSPQSMQIAAPDIETKMGTGYLENNKSHYTLQWTVVDKDGNAQPLTRGNSRVDDYWTIHVDGDPFTLKNDNKLLTVTDDASLSAANWNKWTAPVFFAPKNMTMKQITDAGIKFVCKLYEDDHTTLNESLVAMTYTVFIDRQQQIGQLKDGGKRSGETITTITVGQTEATINLKDASDAFYTEMGEYPTYARIYLTKSDGTLIDPTTGTEMLTDISGATQFTTATNGYYLQDETNRLTALPTAKLTLPANTFNYYYVVVAMSKDMDETTHTNAFTRAADVTSVYEPDYDYIYTIKFAEASTFPGTLNASAFKHANEVLVKDETVTSVDIKVSDRYNKILQEYEKASATDLFGTFHVRWYVTKKNDDGEYEKIPNSELYLIPKVSSLGHQTELNQGLYWNSKTKTIDWAPGEGNINDLLDVTFNRNPGGEAPQLTGEWEDYKIYVVMATDLSTQTDNGEAYPNTKLTHEPDNLTMLNTYSFFKESTFQFVHDKGASERPFLTKTTNPEINATVQQYSWDNANAHIQSETGDIRQGVHTVEYDIYVNPGSSTPVELYLPFQYYFDTNQKGNALEPTAYIRWYDWTADVNSNRLAIVGSDLKDLHETNNGVNVSRGFFYLNNDEKGRKPTHNIDDVNTIKVGVTFNPSGLTTIQRIACDVSKFYDGIYTDSEGKEYLMHEPTLSTRYIINIHPAKEIAEAVKAGKTKFDAKGADMFQLAEDNGRVSVAIKDAGTTFSYRANLSQLDDYYIYNGSSLVNCSKISWYAFYEDEMGIYQKDDILKDKLTDRITYSEVSELNGNYTSISGGGSKFVNATAGDRFHLVGYIGDGTTMAPAIHYEIILQDAPAYKIGDLPLERTPDYLKTHMQLQATVNFDDLAGGTIATITSQLDNHTTQPVAWDQAEYGFCYPDVRRIWTSNDDLMGISPLHGDYMLLRSMNLSGISSSGQGTYYKYKWWDEAPLLDYTKRTDGDYGSFLYVDASEESRTIAKMSFNANLCAGSELCFTGYVADMTQGNIRPQVMATVYAIKTNGTRTRVVSFLSSDLDKVVNDATYSKGIWYQMYGKVPIPSTVDLTNLDHYEVDIDNYSRGTEGADYAVDQLQFYTSTAKLKVKQADVNCGDEKVKMNIYIDAEAVKSYAGKHLYWRICDKDGNPISAALKLYDDADATLTYGTTAVPATVPATIPTEATFDATTPNSGYFTGSDGMSYFSLASKYFALEQGVQYYVSVYQIGEASVTDEGLWGSNTDPCDIFSPIFVPKMMYLEMKDGSNNAVTTVSGSCTDKKASINLKVVLQMPDDDEVSGFKAYDAVHFDFFLGTLAEYQAYGLNSVKLEDALKDYRGKNGGSTTYQTETSLNAAYESGTGNNYKVIKQAIDAGLLFLDYKNQFTHEVTASAENTAYVTALPVEDKVNNGSKDFHICTPLEFVFTVDVGGSAPSIVLGFEDVNYSGVSGVRVVRVGKEQLANMQKTDGFLLHIPVNTFLKNASATAKAGTLEMVGDLDLLKYQGGTDQTTDSRVTETVDKVATFEGTDITSSHMYISVNFHGSGVASQTFYEGFAYRMFFTFRDKDGGAGACDGKAEFLLKVVPEFVTWNGTGTNTEWNNDANWKRSAREELYKGAKGTATNTATAAHPDGYEQNGEGTLATVTTTPNTYVPMKFTYVTMPTGKTAPVLINLAYSTEGIYNNIGTGATANIQYDLMVRYTEKTCQGGANHTVVSGDIYDCEKFYGNWAKDIYFKPEAELLNQQYLTYEKVWVEKELTANTWTLMSTPLQNTYAGDMYVPYNSSDAAKNGRQLTEAFQDINFSTTANSAGFLYSRTKYPIYQKAWTQEGVFVYTKKNDVRFEKYSGNIPESVNTTLNQWSHVYNDVSVPYSIWTAFAVRPHRQTQSASTLIRLPKADTQYDYYQWNNTIPAEGAKEAVAVSKPKIGKLLTDGESATVTYGTVYGTTARTAGTGTVDELVSAIQSSPSNYQLVGNPYLCTVDMTKFLSGNTANLDVAGYWTYTNNSTASALTNGYIPPMTSFLVKVKTGTTKVVFTPDMMVDGSTVSSQSPARRENVPALTLSAHNAYGSSEARLEIGEENSLETLFDSNLADVPMVYTVAGGQAVSVDVRPTLDVVPFGVSCAASDELVDVTIERGEGIMENGEIYVLDALTGEQTAVQDGETILVQPNDYGRYFLTTRSGATAIGDSQLGQGIVVKVRGRQVTVSSQEPIESLRIISTGGQTVYSGNPSATETTILLPLGGIYVIDAQTQSRQQTLKAVVK